MYIRLPALLAPSGTHNLAPSFHTDQYILESLNSLGCTLPARLGADGNRASVYITEKITPGQETKTGSLLHFRDLATKNAEKVFDEKSLKEIEKFGIYFGTLPTYEANFYVARTSDESLTFYISQREVTKLHRCSQDLISRLIDLPIMDIERTLKQIATVYSAEAKSKVGVGRIHEKSLKSLMASAKTEFLIGIFAACGIVLFGAVSHFPDQIANFEIANYVRWATEIWKASLGALIGSMLSIVARYRSMNKRSFSFEQVE